MFDNHDQPAWRTDEQLIDESLNRVFGEPPKIDATFEQLLERLSYSSGRQDDKKK